MYDEEFGPFPWPEALTALNEEFPELFEGACVEALEETEGDFERAKAILLAYHPSYHKDAPEE